MTFTVFTISTQLFVNSPNIEILSKTHDYKNPCGGYPLVLATVLYCRATHILYSALSCLYYYI